MAQTPSRDSSPTTKVGLVGLVGIVVSAMVGGGIYTLPASVATHASAGALLVAWLVTGVGMWFVVDTFRELAVIRPDLTNGIFSYAETGFGKFVGFLVAFGYWMTSCCAMASYGILVMATLSAVFPALGAGNTLPALVGASCLVWGVFAIARRGLEQAAIINVVGTVAKFVPVAVFIVVVLACFSPAVMQGDFYGSAVDGSRAAGTFDNLLPQVSSVMMVTLWVFIGIEGAVVVSGEARSQKLVARATVVGFAIALAFYVLVSVLPFGLMSQSELAGLSSPSTAAILQSLVGPWGRVLISVGIVVSILSSWLVWMCLQGQMPTSAAEAGIFPTFFKSRNRFGAPETSLLWSAIGTQLFLVLAFALGSSAWGILVSITSTMAIPAYFFCSLFLLKSAVTGHWAGPRASRERARLVGIVGSLFGLWLVYSSGLQNLLTASVVFALGLPLFFVGRAQAGHRGPLPRREQVIVVVVACCALAAVVMLAV